MSAVWTAEAWVDVESGAAVACLQVDLEAIARVHWNTADEDLLASGQTVRDVECGVRARVWHIVVVV